MDKKVIEVERKYKLDSGKFADLVSGLESTYYFGCRTDIEQQDFYLPARTDSELLRLRVETKGGEIRYYLLAQAGVKTGDGEEKSLITSEIDALVFESLRDLAVRLTPGKLPEVKKNRHLFHGERDGWLTRVCLDRLEELGEYSGYYLKLEILCSTVSEVSGAVEVLAGLAHEIAGDDSKPVELSYLDMYRKTNS